MKSSFKIEDILYKALNVPAITDLISGEVLKGDVPASSQKDDIVIAVLTNGNEYVQSGFVNVNFFARQIAEGKPDGLKLGAVTTALFGALDNKQIEEVLFDVESQTGAHKDNEPGRDGFYFTNLKIKFNTL